ncbi:carboxypeptidase-like regulatory domain-containing protein [Bacteroides faecis]|nr:carboxypeptidase-like regulatory domain-containing protein [Bacteroides faecis]MCS2194143.1 carboxypeptidase-like regulatory domain-containing protein [Bacteroides faecis]
MKHKAMQKGQFLFYENIILLINNIFVCASSKAMRKVQSMESPVDATGLPLPGVSVTERGATGTTTDLNGQFTLNASKSATLVLSYIGMITQEVKVNSRSMINVTLQEDITSLDEVVVVGYGTQKKIHLYCDQYLRYLLKNY